jgi:hypothetical protein
MKQSMEKDQVNGCIFLKSISEYIRDKVLQYC